MEVFELLIDEENLEGGVNAISLVADPAIESDWITLAKQKVQLKVIDEEKRILMGAALIPNKPIFRRDKDGSEYNIFFSTKTIRQASELFQEKSLQNESTLEHQISLKNNTVVETWIKEHDVHDKSVLHDLDAPVGSWFISMKIKNNDTWKKAKAGEINGFSIEGFFTDSLDKKELSIQGMYDSIMNL
jgi:hypothetical protein